MRHRRRGRKLGRAPSHQRALLRNLASALFLTERDAEYDDNKPKVKGRIITTISKAKEVRPLVEKCITIARRALPALEEAQRMAPQPSATPRPGRPGARATGGRSGRPPLRRSLRPAAAAWCCWAISRQSGFSLRRGAAIRRSPGRIHSYPATGQAASRRCWHAGHHRVCRPE